MTKEEVLQIIKAVAKEMLDETPSHFDAEVDGEVYSDMSRVNVILEMNKKLCAAVESLPDVPDTNDGDMISRKAAIELKPEFLNPNVNRETEERTAIDRAYARGWNSCNTHWIDEINELPSAQPERKKGEWIDETFKPWGLVHHPYKCDQCGEHSEADYDYCPNCGADMRGEQNE